MEFKTLKAIFDTFVKTKIDRHLIETVNKWRNRFYNRNAEHVGFFSTASFGLYVPKWTSADDDFWLNQILDIDEDEVSDYVYALPTINKDFRVSSNILSISFIYLMHRATVEPYFNNKDKDNLKLALMEVMVARYMTSIMNNYFSVGKTTPEISTEIFERLSRRFDLKVAGNWKNWITLKSTQFVIGEDQREDARYGKQEVFERFEDELVVRKLNSVKSQLNKSVVEINQVFREILADQKKVVSKSALSMNVEGLYLGDLVRQQSQYLHYQDSIFIDKSSFLKDDLLYVVESSMPTISTKIFRGALEWIIDNQKKTPTLERKIRQVRHDILIYALELIQSENLKTSDLVLIANRLRQNFLSGKVIDSRLTQARKRIDEFIVLYRPQSKGKLISLERSGIMLYLVLRTLAKNYYKI